MRFCTLLRRPVLSIGTRLRPRAGFLQQAQRHNMMDEFYDEEAAIKAALAASLQDLQRTPSKPPTKGKDIVDLTTDSNDSPLTNLRDTQRADSRDSGDSELQKAIERSPSCQTSPSSRQLQSKNSEVRPSTVDPGRGPSTTEVNATSSPGIFSLLGIDRKKQEEERLARLARKRKADDPVPCTEPERPAKVARSLPIDPTPDHESVSHVSIPKPTQKESCSAASASPLQFPRGAVKKTWALNCQRENDIKFEEVVQKNELELAVLSSFQWDYDWLFTKFDVKKSRFMLVMGHKEEIMVRTGDLQFQGVIQLIILIRNNKYKPILQIYPAFACVSSQWDRKSTVCIQN